MEYDSVEETKNVKIWAKIGFIIGCISLLSAHIYFFHILDYKQSLLRMIVYGTILFGGIIGVLISAIITFAVKTLGNKQKIYSLLGAILGLLSLLYFVYTQLIIIG
jgi:hypothetical protein